MIAGKALSAFALLLLATLTGVLLLINGWPRTGWSLLGIEAVFIVYSFAWTQRAYPSLSASDDD